jgi:site-specific recombinase XerD
MMKDVAIHKIGVRQKLLPRSEPYWGPKLATNQSLGFRKISAISGSWIARLKRDGKRTYQSLGVETESFGFDQAHAAALAWFEGAERIAPGNKAQSVETACKLYVEDRRKEISEANAHDADMRFKRTVYGTAFGARHLSKLETTHIKEWRNALIDPKRKRPMVKASANRTLTSLKAALNLAVEERRASANLRIELEGAEPFAGVGNRRKIFLDLKQRQALLKKSKGAVKDLIWATMLTGGRAGELVNATCGQFEAATGTLTLKGKTGERAVPLSPAAVKLFTRLAENKQDTDYLLVRDDGKPWAHSDWDELVRDAAAAAKLPKGTCLYVLRHSYITSMLQAGLPVSDVGGLVGTSAQMIEDYYHQFVHDHVRARLAKVRMV